jgi:hypothetical protein
VWIKRHRQRKMADFLKILLYLETSLTPYFCLTTTSVLSLRGDGRRRWRGDTVCFTDLDQGSKMIIFESILATFIASVVFSSPKGSSKNWLELKIKPP